MASLCFPTISPPYMYNFANYNARKFWPVSMRLPGHFYKSIKSCSKSDNTVQITRRPATNFHPNLWNVDSLASSGYSWKPDEQIMIRIQDLVKDVKEQLSSTAYGDTHMLTLIETVQRLGVGYHFENEIENTLQLIGADHVSHDDGNLHIVALRFRLLRQAGYNMSSCAFEKFKDDNGDFHESLISDVLGMLSLYEASYLGCKGEDILDEAISFTTKNLKIAVDSLNNPLGTLVQRSLDIPLHKRFPRVEARHYISFYEENELRNEQVLQLAKLDYNLLQAQHKAELGEVSRWWEKIDIPRKLPFKMRERLVEGYILMQILFFDPKHSFGRIYLGKLIAIITILDDTFDVYGTLEELQPLTDAILRWDVEQLEDLPDYLKATVVELINLFNEVHDEMTRRGQSYSISYFKNHMKFYVRYLMEEAKLFSTNEVPPLEEWLAISTTTVGACILAMGMAVDMWEHATKETLDWVSSTPHMLASCCRICRFANDIQTFKVEEQRGNVVSSVSCIMKEQRISEEHAIKLIRAMMQDEWKEMNSELLKPTCVSKPLLTLIMNVTRMAEVLYVHDDGYSNSKGQTKEIINWLLVHPVPA